MKRVPLHNGVFRVQRAYLDTLKALSSKTRVRQSEYLREAVADYLTKHRGQRSLAPFNVTRATRNKMVATNCLFQPAPWLEFHQLSQSTRVEKSVMFREALYDLLKKYEGSL